MKKQHFSGDFQLVLIDRIMPRDITLSSWENFILSINSLVRKLSITEIRNLNLDATNTVVEQVPIIMDQPVNMRITRIQ
jgi:KUP system potassium uptake protein